MGWSTRLFLLSADDMLHRLASSAFDRMLRPGSRCGVSDFAGHRVRQASVTVEVADGIRHHAGQCPATSGQLRQDPRADEKQKSSTASK